MKTEFTHFDDKGNAIMVDVSQKEDTLREATACGTIFMSGECFSMVMEERVEKGDVLAVARVAGIMAAKKTGELIPMCHPLMLTKVSIDYEINEEQNSITALCTAKLTGKTGVEMEALTGVSVALLTIYDMCKAVDKSMVLSEIHLVKKTGGKSGTYLFDRK